MTVTTLSVEETMDVLRRRLVKGEARTLNVLAEKTGRPVKSLTRAIAALVAYGEATAEKVKGTRSPGYRKGS